MLDELGVDTRAQQVVTDERVARPAIGEPFGARLRKSAIVDESCPHERRERFDSLVLGDASRRELIVDLRGAAIAMAQGTQRRLDGVARPARASAQLSTGTASSISTSATVSAGA